MAAAFRQSILNSIRTTKAFERVLSKLEILKLENGECLAELKIEEGHTNALGGLHGGFSATLVDSVSSMAINTHPKVGFTTPTVSVDIHTSYLKGAQIDDVIEIVARTLRVGRTLGFLEVQIRNKKNKDVLVKGSHTKFIFRKADRKKTGSEIK